MILVLGVHLLGQIIGILKANLVSKVLLRDPLPDLLHTGVDDGLLKTSDILAVDRDIDFLAGGLYSGPVGDGEVLGDEILPDTIGQGAFGHGALSRSIVADVFISRPNSPAMEWEAVKH